MPAACEEVKKVSVPPSGLGFVVSTSWPGPDHVGPLVATSTGNLTLEVWGGRA